MSKYVEKNKGRKQNESQINQEICKICIEGNAKASKSRDTARNPVYIVKNNVLYMVFKLYTQKIQKFSRRSN